MGPLFVDVTVGKGVVLPDTEVEPVCFIVLVADGLCKRLAVAVVVLWALLAGVETTTLSG